LVGLALKFGTTAAEVKRVNRLPPSTRDIFHLKEVLVPANVAISEKPPSEAEKRLEAVQSFRRATNCQASEATKRLEAAHFDLEAALQQWRADKAIFSPPPNPALLSPDDDSSLR